MTETVWDCIYDAGEQLNEFPYPEIIRFCKNATNGLRAEHDSYALDIGFGSGVHSHLLASFGYTVCGLDNSHVAVKKANATNENPAIDFKFYDLNYWQESDFKISFDLAIDRLSSTHTSKSVIKKIYSYPSNIFRDGAKIYAEFFSDKNTHKKYANVQNKDVFLDFTAGKFASLGQACFFSERELKKLFSRYKNLNLKHSVVKDTQSNEIDARWLVEAEV